MTTEKALDLALEALGLYQAAGFGNSTDFNKQHEAFYKAQTAITAIKQARALDKKAENARELGLDYEPVQEPVAKLQVTLQDRPIDIELAQYKRMFEAACSALGEVSEALGCDPNEGGSEPLIEAIARLKSSSYEPIAWMVYTLDGKSVFVTDNPTDFTDEHRALPLYTTPPAQPATEESSATQPAPAQESHKGLSEHLAQATNGRVRIDPVTGDVGIGTPAAQRQWVGLTDEETQALWDRYAHMEMMRAIEAKLKEKNT